MRFHPDSEKVNYVLQGLHKGFSLEYHGNFRFRAPKNLPTAQIDPQLIQEKLAKEVKLGRMLGPFSEPPFPDLMCCPVGLVPKKDTDEMRMIMHLSYPYGESINDYIDPEKAATQYQQFEDAVQLVIKQGRFCWLAKGNVKSAFRVAPVCFQHIRCLGIKFQDEYFVDITLPFGSAISCAIFEEIATLIHWIFKQKTAVRFVHYLDDYIWVHKQFIVCMSACHTVQAVVREVGLPLVPEKFVWPTQKLDFLGLTIDTIRMAVAIPRDKRQVILKEIDKMLGVTKCKVKQVQSLAGCLNFVTRAVPHGRPFSRKLYSMVAGMKLHWHVSVTREVKRDLLMWRKFIQEYGGWTTILTPDTPVVHVFTNAATTPHLGWGAWWDTAWMWDQWEAEFMHQQKPSIDFLELFAVLVAVYAWCPYFANKHVIVHSDNQPTVAVINAKSSNSPSMLILIRFLMLHSMLNNIKITSQFVPGARNERADALSHLQFSRFRALHWGANQDATPPPGFLSPLCNNMLESLWL